MNNRITNHRELLLEKERLKGLLAIQKEKIRTDINSIREEFRPAMNVLSTAETFVTSDKISPVVSTLVGIGTSGLFAKSNSLIRFLGPKALGGLTSRLVSGVANLLKRNGKRDRLPEALPD